MQNIAICIVLPVDDGEMIWEAKNKEPQFFKLKKYLVISL